MDRTGRTFAKAFSWQLIGLITMTGLGTIFTGSAGIASGLALTSAALGTLCYIGHEKLWARITWGRLPEQGTHSAANESDGRSAMPGCECR